MNDRKILVVDDEETIRDLFKHVFESAGFETYTAEGGEEALAILRKVDINVMFLDLNMPGMNGIELCKEIRKTKPDAFLYAVTGFSNIFEAPECLAAGFNDYFFKPAQIKSLINTAQESFDKLEGAMNSA